MSSRSRALAELAEHFEGLARKAEYDAPTAMYTAADGWSRAADMARGAAGEQRWRERLVRLAHRMLDRLEERWR